MLIRYLLSLAAVLCLFSCSRDTSARTWLERPWKKDVIYFMMTDRFHDGDADNNQLDGAREGIYDPKQEHIDLYHGGDFRGVEKALQDGYFNDLGITAIWMTPPVKNAWYTRYDLGGAPKTGYHGYWAQDFLDIDPHLTSARSLDGQVYAEGREGRLQHYRDLVKLAHSKGIKVIQDIVCNHAGPVFFYDFNQNRKADGSEEWMPPYKRDGSYHDIIHWGNDPAANQQRLSGPTGKDTVLGRTLNTTGLLTYPRAYLAKGFNDDSLGKSDGEERLCDFFTLRAYDTRPDSKFFDELVDEFVEIYYFYINDIGVDGLRIDTIKHVHKEFWDAFIERLHQRLGDDAGKLLIYGEDYGNSIERIRYYGQRDHDRGRAFDGLLNFQFMYNVRNYLRNDEVGSPDGLNWFYDNMDNLPVSLRQRSVNFIGNHDGVNRFLVEGVEEENQLLALAMMLTSEGIPCLYYGSELSMRDDDVGTDRDSETGRRTLFDNRGKRRFNDRNSDEGFAMISELSTLRQELEALVYGEARTIDLSGLKKEALYGLYRSGPVGDGLKSACVILVNADDPGIEIEADVLRRAVATTAGNLVPDKIEFSRVYENGRVTGLQSSIGNTIQVPGESLQVLLLD